MPTKTTDTFWKRFFKGVVIALGFILPGVSGGVLAAILGIYERLLGLWPTSVVTLNGTSGTLSPSD